MNASTGASETPRSFEEQLASLRSRLHRYCARMTGSVIDAEDVVQDALVKAVAALSEGKEIANIESWLFRIAHNAALDFLRRRTRLEGLRSDEDPEMIVDPFTPLDDPLIVEAGLRTFMRLPVAQRSSVVLMDVLGYPLVAIGEIMNLSIPAVKSALHRGRARLRELAAEPDDHAAPVLEERERSLLAAYVERFNARDFDAVRDMLAEEVHLELVNRTKMTGPREVIRYFENYASVYDWRLAPGFIEGRPAILVCDPDPTKPPRYFVLLEWTNTSILRIRDFRYARYVMGEVEVILGH